MTLGDAASLACSLTRCVNPHVICHSTHLRRIIAIIYSPAEEEEEGGREKKKQREADFDVLLWNTSDQTWGKCDWKPPGTTMTPTHTHTHKQEQQHHFGSFLLTTFIQQDHSLTAYGEIRRFWSFNSIQTPRKRARVRAGHVREIFLTNLPQQKAWILLPFVEIYFSVFWKLEFETWVLTSAYYFQNSSRAISR